MAAVSKTKITDRLNGQEQEKLEELLARLKITNWDVVLVGDGSGSDRTRAAGWGSVVIEKATMERTVDWGLSNHGTVNFAEMMAYIQALDWLSGREDDRRKSGKSPIKAYQVHIITDSDYCRKTGNSKNRMMTKNTGLWAVFDMYARHGFILNWHHLGREQCALNSYCDKLSKMARKLGKEYNLQDKLIDDGIETLEVAEINPSESAAE